MLMFQLAADHPDTWRTYMNLDPYQDNYDECEVETDWWF